METMNQAIERLHTAGFSAAYIRDYILRKHWQEWISSVGHDVVRTIAYAPEKVS